MEQQDLSPVWQETPVDVFGQKRFLGEVVGGHLYHGTTIELPEGTVLRPGVSRNFQQSPETSVCLTSEANRARYWPSQTGKDLPVFVYEVEPLSPVSVWRVGLADHGRSIILWEGRATEARIVRCVFDRSLSAGQDKNKPVQ